MDPRKPEIRFGASYVPYLLPSHARHPLSLDPLWPCDTTPRQELSVFNMLRAQRLGGELLAAFGKVSFCMSSIPIVCLGVILLPCSKWIALDQSQSKGSWCCQVSRLWGHWSSDQQLDHQYLPQWETRPLTICVHTLYIGELGQHSLVIPPPCRKPFLLLVVAVNVVVVVGVSACGTSNVRSSGGAAAEVLKCLALQGPACMSLM